MTIRGAVASFLGLSLVSVFTVVASNYPLQVHLTEWKTLPTGERVSCPEKMRRSRMESWDRSATDARLQLWREEFSTMASSGRKFNSSARRSLVMSATTEVSALLAFRASIQTDPTGALANWTMERGSTLCSTWKGVTCNVMGQVTGLELQDLGLKGTITPRIGDLVHLSLLNLSSSSFSGALPAQLTSGCQNLSILDVSNNSLDGKISPEFFTLPKLALLRLSYNSFSGFLPEVAVDGCQSLSVLKIAYTGISGVIPSSLSRCQKLMVLSLVNNQLNGSIPGSLGELQQLQHRQLIRDSP